MVNLRCGKPVFRLTSNKADAIANVSVRLDFSSDVWHLLSIYPTPSNTDHNSFVEWNDVYPNGRLCFRKQENPNHFTDRLYPSIGDEYEHQMLFWEALTHGDQSSFHLHNSLCVPRLDFIRVLNYLLMRMSFSSEDRDDMITYIIPQLDEADPNSERTNIRFRFFPEEEYAKVAPLRIRPAPTRTVPALLLYGFGDDDEQIFI